MNQYEIAYHVANVSPEIRRRIISEVRAVENLLVKQGWGPDCIKATADVTAARAYRSSASTPIGGVPPPKAIRAGVLGGG
jgi:hypothetical protein